MFKTINGGKLPERATIHSAGFDVFANKSYVIDAGETVLIDLGIALIDEPLGSIFGETILNFNEIFYFELHPRSSLRLKGVGGGVGIIDIDYRDEIKMIVTNPLGYSRLVINRGDKIGQLIFKRHEGWLLPPEYTKDEVRNGGFGSTNEK